MDMLMNEAMIAAAQTFMRLMTIAGVGAALLLTVCWVAAAGIARRGR
jgi:hypothetical protein